MNVNLTALVPAQHLKGEDDEDTARLQQLSGRALAYIQSFQWCRGVRDSYFGLGVGGIVAVFLLNVEGAPGVDDWLWVVVGDLPSCYLVTDGAPDAVSALQVYCDLMSDWVRDVQSGTVDERVFPVRAPPTPEAAQLLATRIECLRATVIPAFLAEAPR